MRPAPAGQPAASPPSFAIRGFAVSKVTWLDVGLGFPSVLRAKEAGPEGC